MREKRHVIDMLLPLSLFLMLAASSLFVMVLSAGIYQHNVESRNANYDNRLCLSYITEKIRQNDKDAEIHVSTFDGLSALSIERTYAPGSVYTIYLYFDEEEGALYEAFVPSSQAASMDRSAGEKILEIASVQMAEEDNRSFYIFCTDASGQEASTHVSLRTDGKEPAKEVDG